MRNWIGLIMVLTVASCAPSTPPPPPVAQPAPMPVSASLADWERGFKAEAMGQGIRPELLDAAFRDFTPIPRIIELDRKQPEGTMNFPKYKQNVIPASRVAKARQLMAENATLLNNVSARFGVPAQYIVALWGIESDFGNNTGSFEVVHALATLAYDGRRSEFFRGELMKAFHILNQGHISLEQMTGSWAGAMGQSQFMPSSFLNFAVDFNGDGRKDIWNTKADIFASIANYLASSGWKGDQSWGMQVNVPASIPISKEEKTLSEWNALGVRQANGAALPASDIKAMLVRPEGGDTYIALPNYKVIMKWNRSIYFATAVGLLADSITNR